ncbi:hypothetical protein C8R43DRAFT_1123048 [Mycena crocata]|nr:hypothetical protein C8R43DRAFT_1123048 [Mycena crocata]
MSSYAVATDVEDVLQGDQEDYDTRDDEILSLKVAEANLKKQLVQATQKEARAIQLVQKQSQGVAQPTPMAAETPDFGHVMAAIATLNSVAHQMQPQQFLNMVPQVQPQKGGRQDLKSSAKPLEDLNKQKRPAPERTKNIGTRTKATDRPEVEKEARRARIVAEYEGESSDDEETRPEKKDLPFKDVPPIEFSNREKTREVPSKTNKARESEPLENKARESELLDKAREKGPRAPASNINPMVDMADVAYRLRAPIEQMREASARSILESIKKTFIPITFEDLMAVAPSIQRDTKSLVTKRRIAPEESTRVHFQEGAEEIPEPYEVFPFEEEEELVQDQFVHVDAISTRQLPECYPQFMVTKNANGLVPAGAIVANDPVLQYLAKLPKGQAPKKIFVMMEDQLIGKDSAALRVLYPLINGQGEEEAILDGGSQIVSMALATAMDMGVPWDPDITIFMQSANGQVEKTVGLAKNIPYRFGDITIFLQVHVIKDPAYKVLLGRPFDILTASTVQNEANGNQMVTLTDPVSKRRCTLPTHARGAIRRIQRTKPAKEETENKAPEETEANF